MLVVIQTGRAVDPQRAMTQLRRGWTLFELMVVMALIVIVGAVAAPSLSGSYANYRLKSAADGISTAFAKARSSAMKQGCAYRVSILPNTGNYRICPDNPNTTTTTNTQPGEPPVIDDHLPPGVQISLANTHASDRTDPNATLGSTVGTSDAGQYVVAVVFQPDGTARTDVQLVLSMQGASPLAVNLRGMTGSVTTGPASQAGVGS